MYLKKKSLTFLTKQFLLFTTHHIYIAGTVEQFEMVCNSYNESLLLIVDHQNLSEAHMFCYDSADKKKMHMQDCNRIRNLFAKRRINQSFNSTDIPSFNHVRQLNELFLSISDSLKQLIMKYGIDRMQYDIINLIREEKFDFTPLFIG